MRVRRRFEIIVSGEPQRSAGAGGKRWMVLGRLGSMLAAVLSAVLAIGLVIGALVLGYLIAGLVLAVFFLVGLLAMVRSAFRALSR